MKLNKCIMSCFLVFTQHSCRKHCSIIRTVGGGEDVSFLTVIMLSILNKTLIRWTEFKYSQNICSCIEVKDCLCLWSKLWVWWCSVMPLYDIYLSGNGHDFISWLLIYLCSFLPFMSYCNRLWLEKGMYAVSRRRQKGRDNYA